ncbi:MAG: sigma 54-interacting transcriptional regulator, partial [Firmicutes bacterium]|nr:sigma 54-interacting transcriptional regulator [Bacillota bacterium]
MPELSSLHAFCREGKDTTPDHVSIGNLEQVRENSLATECGDEHSFYFSDGEAYTLGVNRNYEKLTGLAQEYVYGRNIRELEKLYFEPSVTLKVLKTHRPLTIIQHHYTRNKKLLVTGNPVFNQEGKIILVVTLVKALKTQRNERFCLLKAPSYTLVGGMVINSPPMQEIIEKIAYIAGIKSNVVITGESGTGKELIARSIHDFSPQKEGPFIPVNTAAIPENLLEAELFGYVGGAFTGANPRGSQGFIKKAAGGILFLDEIGELPLALQAKLLRFLENKEIIPVGGNQVERVDVRVICATNRNLEQMMAEGKMRKDLYYRLNVFNIFVPPLRDRKEDIPALCSFYLEDLNRRFNTRKYLTPAAVKVLESHTWPGNVRELKNLLERLVVLYPANEIGKLDVEKELSGTGLGNICIQETIHTLETNKLYEAVAMFEKKYISDYLSRYNSIEDCARAMGIHRTTLMRKM